MKIIADLMASTPSEEGTWFAAAKDAGLYDKAIALAKRMPCDPRTLTRAGPRPRCHEPGFAVEAGLAALHWITAGRGYEITGAEVLAACSTTMDAARNGGLVEEAQGRMRALITGPRSTAKDRIAAALESRRSA